MTKLRQFGIESAISQDVELVQPQEDQGSHSSDIIIDGSILAAIREKIIHDAAFSKFGKVDDAGLNDLLGLTFDQALRSYPKLLRIMGDVLHQVSSSLEELMVENNSHENLDRGIEFALMLKKYGLWCFQYGYFSQALKAFHSALSFLPEDEEVHEMMGDIYSMAENFDHAVFYYEDAHRLAPDERLLRKLVDAKVKVADSMVDDDVVSAYQHYEEALEYIPNYIPALCGMGYCFLLEDNFESAQIYFSRAIEADPSCVRALVGLGNVHLAMQDEIEAESLYREAILKDPEFVPGLEAMANLHYAYFGNLRQALDLLRKAIDLEPRNVDLLYFMARVLLSQNEADQAEMVLKNILEICPDHKDAFDLYAYLVNGEYDGTYIPDSEFIPVKPDRFVQSRDFYFSLQLMQNPGDSVLLSTYEQRVRADHELQLSTGDGGYDPFQQN